MARGPTKWGCDVGTESLTDADMVTNYHTLRHIRTVGRLLNIMIRDLMARAECHDQSKLEPPEVALFTEFTPKLAGSTYGSAEYEEFRRLMAPALEHHYAKNSHHPEHYPAICNPETLQLIGDIMTLESADMPAAPKARLIERLRRDLAAAQSSVNGMNLLDVLEMFCDWKAATLRHNNGNLRKSIEHNTRRFGMSDMLVRIMENTVDMVDEVREV